MTRRDADIQRDVVGSLYWDTRLDAADVGVTVRDGQVRLAGSVATFRARSAAREDAEIIDGVREVVNELAVEVSAELDAPSDEELADVVRTAVTADPDLPASQVEVEVAAGKVRLHGVVRSFWEKEVAGTVVAVLPGVRGLRNELTVVPSGDHTDAAIAEDLWAALARNRHIDPGALDVVVERGEVRLAGTVASDAVRQQVRETAERTAGVVAVDDQLRVPG